MRTNTAQRDKKRVNDETSSGRQTSTAKLASVVGTNMNDDITARCTSPSNSNCNDESIAKHPEYQKMHRALCDYQAKLCKLEAKNHGWKRENQRLQQQIVGYRQNTQTQHCIKLEKDLNQNKVLTEELSQKLGDSEAELLRTKGTLKERDTAIQGMKDEYNRLFAALQKAKPPGSHSPARLQRGASSVTLTKAVASGCISSRSMTSNNVKSITTIGARDDGHEDTNSTGLHTQANDNPYLISHYKCKIEQLEKSIEGLQVQIRKMIASEYRHKQKNRALLIERSQLLEICDRLKRELDTSVLAAAKTITNTQKQLTARETERRLSWSASTSRIDPLNSSSRSVPVVNGLSKSSSSTTVGEIKRLRQRNEFLEERFRCVLRAAGASSSQTATARPVSATAVTRPHVYNSSQGVHNEEDDVSEGDDDHDEVKPRKSSYVQLDAPLLGADVASADAPKPRLHVGLISVPAETVIVSPALREAVDSALAPAMLQQLQLVQRKARVRI